MKFKRIVVAIYIDPDFFPPTINAILNLAERCEEVIVISRNNATEDYPYPPNVHLRKIGSFVTVRELERERTFLKIKYFFQFVKALRTYSKSNKTNLIVLYDTFALFAFYLTKRIRRKKKIWYHNHDIPNRALVRKLSIGGLASRYENHAMQYIDFFSLPAKERLQYYPNLKAGIKVFVIPNYPSLKVYAEGKKTREDNAGNIIRIIYQGFIGPGHLLEEILALLHTEINGYSLQLVLKGSVTAAYKIFLNGLAEKYKAADKLTWLSIGPYKDLPALTASCDIGLGVNTNTDLISRTQGTASNKIYEYAASGLPVVLNESKEFKEYLGKYQWTFFTNGLLGSVQKVLENITADLRSLSCEAHTSFKEELNFEKRFQPVLQEIQSACVIQN